MKHKNKHLGRTWAVGRLALCIGSKGVQPAQQVAARGASAGRGVMVAETGARPLLRLKASTRGLTGTRYSRVNHRSWPEQDPTGHTIFELRTLPMWSRAAPMICDESDGGMFPLPKTYSGDIRHNVGMRGSVTIPEVGAVGSASARIAQEES